MNLARAKIVLFVFTLGFLVTLIPSKVSPSLSVRTKCGIPMRDSIFIDDSGVYEKLSEIILNLRPNLSSKAALGIAKAVHSSSLIYRLDPALVISVMRVESNFESAVVSYAGAVGLMQVLPSTGRYILEKEGLSFRKSFLVRKDFNVRIGVSYLRYLLDKYGGDIHLALTAYNMGPGNLNRVISKGSYRGSSSYSREVMLRYRWVRDREPSFLTNYLCEIGSP